MENKVIILGAGIYQVPLIKEAKRQGLFVIVISIKGNYPGFKYADLIYYTDTTNRDEVLKISKNENINAICTTGTDVPIKTIGYVNDSLKLNGIGFYSATLSSDKMEMKTAFKKGNVATADFKICKSLEDAFHYYDHSNHELIMKAIDSSGSRGVVKVNNREDINYAYNNIKSVTRSDYFLIEEFITGEEFGVQALVQNGILKYYLIHGDLVHFAKTGVPIGHYYPYDYYSEVFDTIVSNEVTKIINSLKLDNCTLNIDFIRKDDEIYCIEVGARTGATCLAELVSISLNRNCYKDILNLALGIEIEHINKPSENFYNKSILLTSDKNGIIESYNLPISENLYEFVIDYQIGDEVRKFNVGPDRIGHIIVRGNNFEEIDNEIKYIKDQINLKID